MNPSLWNKRIPTAAGFVFLMIGVIVTSILVQTGTFFPIQATPSEDPVEMRISNITDTSFTVSYVTASEVTGSIAYGETPEFGSVAFDERDKAGNTPLPHAVHYIMISNLKPKTAYKFAILSGSKTYEDEEYTIQTAPAIDADAPEEKTITGSLLLPNGTKPTEAIVYAESTGAQVLSAFAQGGTYTIPLTHMRTDNFETYAPLSAETLLLLSATSGTLHSTAEITAGQTDIPPITLSQQYEFTLVNTTPSPAEAAPTQEGEEQPATTGETFPEFASDTAINTNPQILTPQKDEALTDQQPEFTGTAPPGRTIEILIESSHEIKATVKADKNGKWSFRPEAPLEPGEHTITITTRDEAGIVRTILQSFVVNAQGSQFTQPSIAPTRRPTSTPTRTPTPTVTKAPTVTTTTTPSLTPTSIPTATTAPTVTTTTTPTTRPTLPVVTTITLGPTQPPISPPGSGELTAVIGLAGFAILAGGMIFLIAQGVL